MYKKKSLIEAEIEARELSKKYKDKIYYVIDKKHGKACCHSVDWLAMQKIRYENYFPVCTYKNGIRGI